MVGNQDANTRYSARMRFLIQCLPLPLHQMKCGKPPTPPQIPSGLSTRVAAAMKTMSPLDWAAARAGNDAVDKLTTGR